MSRVSQTVLIASLQDELGNVASRARQTVHTNGVFYHLTNYHALAAKLRLRPRITK